MVVIAVLLASLHYRITPHVLCFTVENMFYIPLYVEMTLVYGLLYEILWPVVLKRSLSMHQKICHTFTPKTLLALQQIHHFLLTADNDWDIKILKWNSHILIFVFFPSIYSSDLFRQSVTLDVNLSEYTLKLQILCFSPSF